MRAVARLIAFSFLCLSAFGSELTETSVVVVPSIHGAHKNHVTYDWDVLFSLVARFQPDFVGVEIRPEDIDRDPGYLSSNYPFEMVKLAELYPDKIFGVDWLGDSILGKSIPKGYFANLDALKLSRALNDDEIIGARKPAEIEEIEKKQSRLVEQATPTSLADGSYGRLCRELDELENGWLSGTNYEEILVFNQKRDAEIGSNIIAFVERHRGNRIVVVLGADHRTFAIEAIEKHFGPEVIMLPVSVKQ